MIQEIPVVAAMIQREREILIAQKKCPSFKWEFPGGKIEKGESKKQALIREIFEELGVSIQVGLHIGQSAVVIGKRRIRMDLFACRLLDGEEPTNIEHKQLQWIDPLQVEQWAWAPADIPLLPLVRNYFGA